MAIDFKRRAREAERGQAIPLVVLFLVLLMGTAALAVDVGYLRHAERVQQSAADSAAIAGAAELAYPAAADVTAAARSDAASNGFTDNGSNVIVTVNNPPTSGAYSGNAAAVEVIARVKHPTFLEGVFGTTFAWIATRAVALSAGGGNHECVYVLKATAPTATLNSTTINAPNCGFIANGPLTFNSDTITAASIGAAGTIITNSSTFPEAHPARAVSATDPCPTIAGCAYLTSNPPAQTPCTYPSQLVLNSWTGTLNPGVYCGGIIFNSATATLNPGVYVIKGGITSNSSTLTGTGITFYIATGAVIINSSTLNLTAPATGNDEGMLFYQTVSDSSSATLNSSGGGAIAGGLYFPSAQLTLNSDINTWMLVVAGWLTLNSTTANIPATSSFPGLQNAVLAE
jgi:hypothetical protein